MNIPEFEEIVEPNDQTEARLASLNALRELGGNVYPNKFQRSSISGSEDTISAIKSFKAITDVEAEMAAIKANLKEGERPPAEVKDAINERLKALGTVRIAGRLTTPLRGNFVHLTDGISKLQIYCNKKQACALIRNDAENTLDAENGWAAWQLLDHGDFVGVEGYLFVTNTGEVSVHVEKLQFLAKAMLPMPDKMHGVEDAEIKQRQRYLDLIASSLKVESHESEAETDESAIRNPQSAMTTREVFETRAKIISSMRRYLEDHGYVEVETPMLTPKATGAAAKPFKTHHNALDIDLYARIAPELYLKRLVVGGFEKVYELNRNFRNEGISYKHNPEFTMLEFYCAYMDVNGMIAFCSELLDIAWRTGLGRDKNQDLVIEYQDHEINLSNVRHMTMKGAIESHLPQHVREVIGFETAWLDDPFKLSRLGAFFRQYAANANTRAMSKGDDLSKSDWIFVDENQVKEMEAQGFRIVHAGKPIEDVEWILFTWLQFESKEDPAGGPKNPGMDLASIFESVAERNLLDPTFIIDYPKSISPLSKASPSNPQIAERFELFINGMEVANGFSELNDPKEQYERFVDQMSERERGDEEAMILDEDYIRALSYGMPPAAGIGIGIDRLVMLLTNKHSIRDVILFPHMRPETKHSVTDEEN